VGTKSGFGELSIASSKDFADSDQMYAAGFLEGALTQPRIWQQYFNVHSYITGHFTNATIPQKFQDFFTTQDAWARAQVATNGSSPVWQGVKLILAQFDGLVAGYAAVAPPQQALSTWDLQQVNAIGDFLDLIPALSRGDDPLVAAAWDWPRMNASTFARRLRETTHCSALIKTDATYSDLWFAHVAWFAYSTTLRIFKSYSFDLAAPAMVGTKMSFSSYPGYLSSLDDHYQVWSSGLAILETTNSIFNTSLYAEVVPQALWAWQRVRNANLLASSGREWSDVFAAYNSGTYNNQYMVLNVASFKPRAALLPDTLWVVEQIPGLVVGGDTTQQLERGYWPSYNVAYWPQIYNASGYPQLIAARAAAFAAEAGVPVPATPVDALRSPVGALAGVSYQLAPRAQIFRRDQGFVNDTASFLALMRSNGFATGDPLAAGSPWNAICSRGDLATPPRADGCYDGKAGTASMWPARQSLVVSGPTTAGGSLPPFAWAAFPGTPAPPHEGLPAVYDFDWDVVTPDW
jgi:hypothetical protein